MLMILMMKVSLVIWDDVHWHWLHCTNPGPENFAWICIDLDDGSDVFDIRIFITMNLAIINNELWIQKMLSVQPSDFVLVKLYLDDTGYCWSFRKIDFPLFDWSKVCFILCVLDKCWHQNVFGKAWYENWKIRKTIFIIPKKSVFLV